MSRVTVEHLKDDQKFEKLAEIHLQDLVEFVQAYYAKRFSAVIAVHYALSLLALAGWLWVCWQEDDIPDALFTSFGFGILTFFVLLPLHEWLHGLGYRFFGAGDVRYRFVPRKLMAYAVAHEFVADRREFIWVALLPSLVINGLLLAAAVGFPEIRAAALAALLVHIGGTSGDFALLNFLWVYRAREVYTYDDAENHVSYFYASR